MRSGVPETRRRVSGGSKAQCRRSRMSGTMRPEFSGVAGTISEEAEEAEEEREEGSRPVSEEKETGGRTGVP